MAWAGSLLVLVHAGIHFNAILAWLAVWAMLINVASGLTGKYLLQRSRRRMEASRQQLRDAGAAAGAVEERLYWDSLTFDVDQAMAGGAFPDHARLRRPGHGAHPERLPVLGLAMKRPWIMLLVAANLAVIMALAFIYPHLMVSPGPLVPAHAQLATDCFACHTPLRGASADRCVTCHAVADIGVRSTTGVAAGADRAGGADAVPSASGRAELPRLPQRPSGLAASGRAPA